MISAAQGFFLLRISLAVCCILCFHMKVDIFFLFSSLKNVFGIFHLKRMCIDGSLPACMFTTRMPHIYRPEKKHWIP